MRSTHCEPKSRTDPCTAPSSPPPPHLGRTPYKPTSLVLVLWFGFGRFLVLVAFWFSLSFGRFNVSRGLVFSRDIIAPVWFPNIILGERGHLHLLFFAHRLRQHNDDMLSYVCLALSFLTPTIRLNNGQRVSLHGTGPPVVFSSGLFGVMPRRIYSQLFHKLTSNLTLIVLEDVAPVTASTVEEISRTLAVERVGFVGHSSFDADVLVSEHVRSAVLCDPVVLPRLTDVGFSPNIPVRVLRAGKAYETNGIPDFISPRLPEATVRTFDDIGHADLLDDTWADFGPRVLPWMQGVVSRPVSFREWTIDAKNKAKDVRKEYRDEVAREILGHVLDSHKTLADDTFIDV